MRNFKLSGAKHLTALVLAVALMSICLFTGCSNDAPEENTDITETKDTVEVTRDVLEETQFERKSDNVYVVTDGVAAESAQEGYNSGVADVSGGEQYVCSFGVSGKNMLTVIFTDGQSSVISQRTFGRKAGDYYELNNVLIRVPENAEKMMLNSCTRQLEVSQLVRSTGEINIDAQLPTVLSIGCVNCGEFDYGEDNITTEYYLGEWQMMLSDLEYDIFMFEDVIDAFSSGVTADSIIGENGEYLTKVDGLSD